ncbi:MULTISPECIES: phosphoenolpyruvate--protein phosphotransferase [Thermoanaerobacter]|uniref:Phosphoenolpyruvate-protein phosphotransferase n=2 Tax=Thermoanaerobacter TaxID=1754 RepID=B0KCG1_THEP3|nr:MULTISPECIES: phosphoenolpyruvate--protein phosphotransferase [Thermoanaerobacter]ABY94004.1 phosphoenolpyruvate-protein phosphotransferase [Thermoanaerobacter pseudethanolicus ATCC 33223]ADV78960.1 phosphoenolpyruvate-protein phosphotransferase [Thermoanaerobacter brockii subsp. finnii Ako-1]HBW60191.1 phosphoenolpyruvate--protein phosphotransferase [Thermoanaerobacter sp.]
MLKGVAASPGIAIGKVFLYTKEKAEINMKNIDESKVEYEIERFKKALEVTKEQIQKIKEDALKEFGKDKAEIFEAHLMLASDPELIEGVENMIKTELITADNAVNKVIEQNASVMESLDDEYLKERAADLRDVGSRIINNLLGVKNTSLSELDEQVIIIAKDLTPSDTATMKKEMVLGFATDIGGRTSHTAIMARSLEIPAVVGLGNVTTQVNNGNTVIVDGLEGVVIVNPDESTMNEYKTKKENYDKKVEKLKKLKDLPAITPDGKKVMLAANIGTPKDVKSALANGAEGVGLFRTEFLYMDRTTLPTEEEQFEAYKEVAEKMEGRPVTIRTLDIGGDKELPYLDMPKEMNPFLGYRAIRLCLDKTDIFKTQLRAILRASAYGNIHIMYPMISSIEDVRKANIVLNEVKAELDKEGIKYDKNIKVGIMVEIPSAAVTADILAKEVDFFSIGTNDLCQYTLAVDRMNEHVKDYYQPFNPAILRLIKFVIDAAHKEGKFAAMCGEMAGDPLATVILLGLGLDEFSMSATSIPTVKNIIRNVEYERAKEIAERVLNIAEAEKIQKMMEDIIKDIE